MEQFMKAMVERLRARAQVLREPPANAEDLAVARALDELADAIMEGLPE